MKRAGREYVRDKVRERDNFTCLDCKKQRKTELVHDFNSKIKGLKGRIKMFDVHHLNGLCGKKSRGYDRMQDMSVLVTLCHKCHFNRPEHATNSKNSSKTKVSWVTKFINRHVDNSIDM